MKKFRCMPIGVVLPIFFLTTTFLWILIGVFCGDEGTVDGRPVEYEGYIMCGTFAVLSLAFAIFTVQNTWWRIEIHQNIVVCKGLRPKDTFEMEYASSNIGFDYHAQNGNRIWWIYICSGPLYQYKSKNKKEQINAIKIKPGFIKIMYSDEVYNALLEVLPKKQSIRLETARRCAGFEKQGRII